MLTRSLLIGCLLLRGILVNGQAVDTSKAALPLTITGEVDAYYRYSSNQISSSAGAYSSAYTVDHNSFSLGIVNMQFAKDLGKIGFMADIMIGPRADFTNALYAGQTPAMIKQLYAFYKPTEKLKLTLGNFTTFVGYELIEASGNVNYSMSYGFSYSPYTHTGLKAEYAFNENWSFLGAVLNKNDAKWDSGRKYAAGQLTYTKGKVKCALALLDGHDGDSLRTDQVDLVFSYQATPKLSLATNISTKKYTPKEGVEGSWTTFILFGNYKVKENFILGARAEYFIDPKNVYFGNTAAQDVKVTGLTFSANYKRDALTIIPEIRFDTANKNIFSNKEGKTVNNETSLILAAVYKF